MKIKDKITQYINTFSSFDFKISLLLFVFGTVLYYAFIDEPKLSGNQALLVYALCYFSLGLGLYGIFKSFFTTVANAVFFVIRLFLFGKITFVFSKGKFKMQFHTR